MTDLTISVPEAMQAFIEAQVARGGYQNTSDYLLALVLEAQTQEAKRELEAKLLEGLASGPATEMTADDWVTIRQQVQERLERRQAG